MTISVISFDGDMTLWDFQKVMRHSLEIVLGELCATLPAARSCQLSVDEMIEHRNTVASKLSANTNLEEVRLEAFRYTLAALGSEDDKLARHLNAVYLRHRFEDIELYPDVAPTLDALAGSYGIGLISNGNSYPERCGLDGHFDFVVFSQDVGVAKPGAQIFRVACEAAGCEAADLLHVGDSLTSDVAGANAFGATSVWLNRSGEPNDSSIAPHYEITSLDALPQILNRCRSEIGDSETTPMEDDYTS